MAIAAVGQFCSSGVMSHNLSQCKLLIKKASLAGAKALFLPEASDYIASSAAETVSLVRSVDDSPFVRGLQKEARAYALEINVGIHEPTTSGKKVKNTSIWIDHSGKITHRYQKIHLFDLEIAGGPVLKESNSVEKGMDIIPPFDTAVGRVGLTICFDVRMTSQLSIFTVSRDQPGSEAPECPNITYPSAFTVSTGLVHWEVLLRARAIETQAYVIAAAQVGAHNEKRVSYGHSMIVDPWGKILAELAGDGKEPEIATAEIDLDYREKILREMPLLRRTDVYPEI